MCHVRHGLGRSLFHHGRLVDGGNPDPDQRQRLVASNSIRLPGVSRRVRVARPEQSLLGQTLLGLPGLGLRLWRWKRGVLVVAVVAVYCWYSLERRAIFYGRGGDWVVRLDIRHRCGCFQRWLQRFWRSLSEGGEPVGFGP